MLARFQRASLKTKLAISAGIGTLTMVAIAATLLLWALRLDVHRSAIDAQQSLIESKAMDLDERISARKEALSLHATALTAPALIAPGELEKHYASRPLFTALFDAIFIADRDGRIIFDTPHLQGRRGRSLKDRAYFKAVMQTGETVISDPVSGKSTNQPNIVFAAPIRNSGGEIIGMIGGIVFLSKQNFLGGLSTTKIGKSGYFALVSKGDQPTIVMHPQTSRIMQPIPDAKSNPYLHRALSGAEETVEGVNSVGVEALLSYRSLSSVPWMLVSIYPTSEAYASLRDKETLIIGAASLLALLSATVLWWLTYHLLAPLTGLRDVMVAGKDSNDAVLVSPTTETKELSEVIAAYNELIVHKREAENRIRDILTHAGDAFISIDADGTITEWNRQAQETFGWARTEAIGKELAALLIPDSVREHHRNGFRRFSSTGQGPVVNKRIEVLALHRDGREIEIELSIAPVQLGERFGANAFLRDIGDRKAAQRKIATSEQWLRTVTDNLPVLISYIDKDLRFRFANATYEQWLGIPPSDMIGHKVPDVIGQEFYEQRRPMIERVLSGETMIFEIELDALGISRYVKTTYIPDRDNLGEICGFYTLTTDISALKAVETQLAQLARSDALTGIPNRRQFEERLNDAMARCRRTGQLMALMFLDIDHFKVINDTLGHGHGDEVLKEFASRLRSSVRVTDTVARLAGDEFVIILENLKSAEKGAQIAHKINTAINKKINLRGTELNVGTSIGIAFYHGETLDADQFVEIADRALYLAKEGGRNTYRSLDCASYADVDTYVGAK